MIITEQKPLEEILDLLKEDRNIFLVGCGECATLCETGGEPQVKEMEGRLREAGKNVTGWTVVDVACEVLVTKKGLRAKRDAVNEADAFLVLACGGGTQAVRECTDKAVYPGCNSLFLGNVQRMGRFEERCSMCGDCILGETGGICPVTRCPKGLLNGPCGGTDNGKCEVDPEKDCVWTLIYDQLAKDEGLDRIRKLFPAKDYSVQLRPARRAIEVTKRRL